MPCTEKHLKVQSERVLPVYMARRSTGACMLRKIMPGMENPTIQEKRLPERGFSQKACLLFHLMRVA